LEKYAFPILLILNCTNSASN